MKSLYVKDIHAFVPVDSRVTLLGWLRSRRDHGTRTFLDVVDSTGHIQVVVERALFPDGVLKQLIPESAIEVTGKVVAGTRDIQQRREILAVQIQVVGPATLTISPRPRSSGNLLDGGNPDHALRYRHLYIRNPKVIAVMQFRHTVMRMLREWFEEKGFTELTAPVLTPLPLYDEGTTIPVTVHGESVYLTQCVGFYLEAAAHALERVYNMGPSFRSEESRSKRHLVEYWHVKAEVAFANLDDAFSLVESIISTTVRRCQNESHALLETIGGSLPTEALRVPYPRISYREALALLSGLGYDLPFGKSLATQHERVLSDHFVTPFWVTGIPRMVEPFPYEIDPDDPEVTRTADLIASRGQGELLGIAEKISDPDRLDIRMQEKRRDGNSSYQWVREVHQLGCVPHIGFGMGLERLLRWLLNLEHVRDVMPFPRIFRRSIYP